MMRKRYTKKGFTLLEVLLVIVIIVGLAAIVLPQFIGIQEGAQIDSTKIQLTSIATSLDNFKIGVGQYPTTDEGLGVLSSAELLENEELVKKWRGPYMDAAKVKDSWGNEFNYISPGEQNEKSYDLWSNGPDGEDGTDDDIKNWGEDEE